jgi:GMP synthase-like glutamine amidotransferase
MKVLILVHLESEGPGTLGTFLESAGVEIRTARLYESHKLPSEPVGLDAIISMGGPMNVYEEDEYPFLRNETILLRNAVDGNLPVMGLCLGAQMIAKARGARVTKSPAKEVGWGKIDLTDAGKSDPLFAGLPSTLDVLQWHEDMFEIPEGGTLLAASEACPHQALRYRNALGLQFHLEINEAMLREWFADSPLLEEIVGKYQELAPEYNRHAEKLYANFLNLIKSKPSKFSS